MVRREFIHRPMLEYLHAETIVLIRREVDLASNTAKFFSLWKHHEAALLQGLNSRWLVSACDTFADYGEDDADRCAGLAGTLLMNTIKLYETERLQVGQLKTLSRSPTGIVPLFDGMTAYLVGRGDMVHNLLGRALSDGAPQRVTVRILQELVRRARAHDTVFRRAADLHTVDETRF